MSLSVKDMTLVSMFAALTAVGAYLKIPVPYVPFTLQWLMIILAGILLGSRLALWSQVTYLAVGLAGIPVFTNGGGPGYVLQPTFGYLIGFAVAAYLIGKIVEKTGVESTIKLLLANLAGLGVVYAAGATYLYLITNYVLHIELTYIKALWFGAVICLPGDLTLSIVGATICRKVVHRISPESKAKGDDVKLG
ncbi:biotin transporter BioY [Desulfolucanica intricata]|uniref:biotin transporter BioY n=1 Tax=Desulfolucanica intricata TaxID=1285191 RepID=UPI000A6E1EF4|nr:biotin transporter BioY [Desulfolucanica intricata]